MAYRKTKRAVFCFFETAPDKECKKMGINLAGTKNPPNTTYTRDGHGGKA